MSHTHNDLDNQKVSTHDDSLSDINIKVERFFFSHLSENDRKGIFITAEIEKSTVEKRITLELEHPDYFGLILLNYKGPKSNDYFPLNSTVKVEEILLRKSTTKSNEFCLKDVQKYITHGGIKHIVTKKESDCCYLFEKSIKDNYTVILAMKLMIISVNNSSRQLVLYLGNVSEPFLCCAIRNKDMEVIEVLLNFKFDVNARSETSATPLHVAVDLEMSDVVDLLISNGADVNATNRQGQVPLHYAAKKNNFTKIAKIINALVQKGANINVKDSAGNTPLHHAVMNKNSDFVQALLKCNAEMMIKNNSGKDVVYLACWYQANKCLQLLLNYNVDINTTYEDGKTALHVAVEKGNFHAVKLILEKNPDVNIKDSSGTTALHSAIRSKCSLIIELLLKNGANMDLTDKFGNIALHSVIESNEPPIIELLLENGANVDLKNASGKTALHIAVEKRNFHAVKLIFKKNPDVNIKDSTGKTALYLAVERKCLSMVELLLKNGANVDLKNTSGKTALHLAIELNIYSIIILLLENDAKDIDVKDNRGRTALHYAVLNTNERSLKMLLEAKADVNVKDSDGNTPLHLTMSQRNSYTLRFECMQVLVNYQADVNAVDNDMRTPLHHACWNKNVEVVEYLIKNGADSGMRDRDGRTVFHYACMIKDGIYHVERKVLEDLLNILVEEDISINCVDKFGKTPLHYVVEKDDYRSFYLRELFLKIGADINIEDEKHNTVIDIILKRWYDFEYQKTKLFIEHVIKMKEMGMWVREKTLDKFNRVKDRYDLQKILLYERDCRKEVDLMNTNIGQCDITYYNFLKKSPHKAMNYTRNENVVNAIKSDKLLAVFPIYGHFLKCHLRDIQRRCNVYEKIQRFSKSNIFERLPMDCMHEIFQYLNNSDLNFFFQALKPVVLIK